MSISSLNEKGSLSLSLSLSLSHTHTHTQSPPEFNYYIPYINSVDVRKAIHVGNLSYGSQSTQVEKSLMNVRI